MPVALDPPGQYSPAGFGTHFMMLMWKNARLKLRDWKGVLLETLLPAVFLVLIIPAWVATKDRSQPDSFYTGSEIDTDAIAALAKCRKPNATDPKLSFFDECLPEHITDVNCIGDLCLAVSKEDRMRQFELVSAFSEAGSSMVPDYDLIALVRHFSRYVEMPGFSETDTESLSTIWSQGYYISIVSDDPTLAAAFNDSLLVKTYCHQFIHVDFPSEAAAIQHVTSLEGGRWYWAVVVIKSESSYAIRMNATATPDTKSLVNEAQGETEQHKQYLYSGFATLQLYLDEWLLGDPTLRENIRVTPMPIKHFSTNEFLDDIGEFLPLLLSFSFLYLVAQASAQVVREKEQRIREGMHVMGLSPLAFKLSWYITFFLQFTIIAILMTITLKLSYFGGTDGSLIFFVFWFYSLSVMGLSLILSACFSSAQVVVVVAPVLVQAFSIMATELRDRTQWRPLLSLISTYSFSEAVILFGKYESKGEPMTWADVSKEDFSMNEALSLLVMDNIIYMILAWYLDRVVPGEWGSKSPFYFCCWPPLWCSSETASENLGRDGLRDPSMVEEVSDASLKEKERVVVKNIRKVFSSLGGDETVAVDNLSLSMYEGQIQVLLGHNGAGKTTLINMLTGMMPVTAGDASVYDTSIASNLSKVRRNIGFCPQHNILWDNMTCGEHLRFFGALKGIPFSELDEKVDLMLENIGLSDKKYSFSSELSGGMKRKLSVGIALIGGSRFIIFDEPTAGIDVEARRHIWDLLKACRQGRTVLLTTHFMDEADLLADTIAIMHDGRLYCSGSSLFLKSKLGVGYTLKIDFDSERDPNAVTTAICGALKERGETVQVLSCAGGELSYKIPVAALPDFPNLFETLENAQRIGVRTFGVSVTTLEEVFLTIENHEQGNPGDMVKSSESVDSIPSFSPDMFHRAMEVPKDEVLKGTAFHRAQFTGLLVKRFRYAKRNCCTIWLQLLLPVLLITLALFLMSLSNTKAQPSLSLTAYKELSLSPAGPETSVFADAAYNVESIHSVPVPARNTSEMDVYLLRTWSDHGGTDRWQAVVQDTMQNQTTGFHNMTSMHASVIVLGHIANVLSKSTGGPSIDAVNHPMPYSEYFKQLEEANEAIVSALFIIIPFTFIPANFVSFLVYERECKAKHVQLVSGVTLSSYWGSSVAWDFMTYLFTVGLAFMIFGIFNAKEYIGDAETGFATFFLFVLYGFASIAHAYFVSFFFNNHNRAQNMLMMFNFVFGFVLVLVVFILILIPSTKNVGKALRFVLRLVPAFCLGDGITELGLLPTYKTLGINTNGPWSIHTTGWDMLYLALQAPVWMLLVGLWEYPELWYKLGIRERKSQEECQIELKALPRAEDEDVAAERKAVETPGGREGDVVTVQGLRKVYPPSSAGAPAKVAVRSLTFGVRQDEVFGLLGTNGAGKTTALSVLSGEHNPTAGRASVKGHDTMTDRLAARRELGYCPQFDALLGHLTPREHLELYAALRGVPNARRNLMIDSLLHAFNLSEYQNKQCRHLSGGNKRKTSIALSLVGNPNCLLLDEPTAGMDPAARRGLWTALGHIGKGRCVILTTHHLEEVEAVAHRVGIMVAGELHCLGTLTHLKHKFGGGYEIEVKTKGLEAEDDVRMFFASEMPEATLVEATNHRLTYAISMEKATLSVMFRKFSEAQEKLGIVDYSLAQTSLDQVFLAICRKANDGDGDHSLDVVVDKPAAEPAVVGPPKTTVNNLIS